MKKALLALMVYQALTTSVFAAETSLVSSDSVAIGSMNAKENPSAVETRSATINGGQFLENQAISYGNDVVNRQIQQMTRGKNAPEWLKRTDISIQFTTDFKPIYSLETINPLGKMTDTVTTFYQFRFGNDLTAGTVANFGLGNRVLSNDKTSMFGTNIFFDHAFRHGHERIGGGLEYFQGRNEYRSNLYHAISGEKEIDSVNHIFEKALSGYDYEIGTSFAKAPWAKLYLKGYHWDYTYANDIDGYKVRTVLQVTSQFNTELGYYKDNGASGQKYIKVMYNLAEKSNAPAMFEANKPVFRAGEDIKVENKRLDKVQRENDIRVETYQKVTGGGGTTIIPLAVTFAHTGS